MTREPLRDLVDLPCLWAAASVFAAEALVLAATQASFAGGNMRFLYLAFGSNGKDTTTSLLIVCVLVGALLKQPETFSGFSKPFALGSARLRCAVLLAAQIVFFSALLAFPDGLRSAIQKGLSEGPTIGSGALRLLWQAVADGTLLLSVLAVFAAGRGRAAMASAGALVLTLGLAASGFIAVAQSLLMPYVRSTTLAVVHRALPHLFDRIIYDSGQRLIGSESYAVFVGADCSGTESLKLMFTCCCLFWIVFRHRLKFPRAFLILPLGVVIMWLANVLRIVALIWVGSRVSPDLATDLFHVSAGWILFDSIAVALLMACASSPLLGGDFPDAFLIDRPAARFLFPLLVAVFLNFLTPRWSPVDAFFPLRVLLIGAALWACFRGRFPSLLQRPSWTAVGIGVVVFLVWIASTGTGSVMRNTQLAEALAAMPTPWRVAWLVFRAAASIVTTPLVEELAFRGYFARWLIHSDFESVPVSRYTPFTLLASSLAFGFLHRHWAVATFSGMLFAVSAMRRGKLSDAITSHMVANALLVAFALTTGRWTAWMP